MDANSVLFTVVATNWINKKVYKHLIRSVSGDGYRAGHMPVPKNLRRAMVRARLPAHPTQLDYSKKQSSYFQRQI